MRNQGPGEDTPSLVAQRQVSSGRDRLVPAATFTKEERTLLPHRLHLPYEPLSVRETLTAFLSDYPTLPPAWVSVRLSTIHSGVCVFLSYPFNTVPIFLVELISVLTPPSTLATPLATGTGAEKG